MLAARLGPISPRAQAQVEIKQRVKTTPKIKMLLSGALAVTDRLQERGLNVHNTCKLCQQSPETIGHVLFHCSPARQLL